MKKTELPLSAADAKNEATVKELKKENKRLLTNLSRTQAKYQVDKRVLANVLEELPLRTLELVIDIKKKEQSLLAALRKLLSIDTIPANQKKETKKLIAEIGQASLVPEDFKDSSIDEMQERLLELQHAIASENFGQITLERALAEMAPKLLKTEKEEGLALSELFKRKLDAIGESAATFLLVPDEEVALMMEKGHFAKLYELRFLLLTKDEKTTAATIKRLKQENKILEKQANRLKKEMETFRKSDFGQMTKSYQECEADEIDPYTDMLAEPLEIVENLSMLLEETEDALDFALHPEKARPQNIAGVSEDGKIWVTDPVGREVGILEEEFKIWQDILTNRE